MKLRALHVRTALVPMTPHRTARGVVTESPLVVLAAVTDEGVTGRSITFTYTAAALEPTAALIRNIEPLLVGDDVAPLEIEAKLCAAARLLVADNLGAGGGANDVFTRPTEVDYLGNAATNGVLRLRWGITCLKVDSLGPYRHDDLGVGR